MFASLVAPTNGPRRPELGPKKGNPKSEVGSRFLNWRTAFGISVRLVDEPEPLAAVDPAPPFEGCCSGLPSSSTKSIFTGP